MPARGRDSTFGEFGIGFVRDVFTPQLLERHVEAAMAGLSFETSWWPNLLSASMTVVQPGNPTIVADDRCERVLQVPVAATVHAELGTDPASVTVDADVDLDLTMRVRAFAPGTVFVAIDPVEPDDLRIDVRAWAPWAAADSIAVGELAERLLPRFAGALNPKLAQSVQQRVIDVLGRILTSQSTDPARIRPGTSPTGAVPVVPPDAVLTGEIHPRQTHVWGVWLAAGERIDADLWAGTVARQPLMFSGVLLDLAVLSPAGRPIDTAYTATLNVRRWVPDLDTTVAGDMGPVLEATTGGIHRLRLSHTNRLSDAVPVAYRIQQRRTYTAASGKRICFDELGDNLVRLGINRDLVASAIGAELPDHDRQRVEAPIPVFATTTARLARLDQFVPKGTTPDRQLWYRPVLDIEVELEIGGDDEATVMLAKLEARASMKVTTRVDPATIVIAFDTVPDTDVQVVGKPKHVRGRKIPFASLALDKALPAQVAKELNKQLAGAAKEIVVGELAAAVPVTAPPGPPRRRLSEPVRFEGRCPFDAERYHAVHLEKDQKVKVKARLAIDMDESSYSGVNVDVAVVDAHGGVHDSSSGTLTAIGKRRQVLELTFEAPYDGDWRVRLRETYVGEEATGFVYEVVVTP